MTFITLRIVDGADRGRTFDDLAIPVTIGREDGNSVQLNDERVSRFHLKIQEDHDKIILTDLESTNGTKVNGENVRLCILRPGDLVHVGRSLMVFGTREEIAERLRKLRDKHGLPAQESDVPVAGGPSLEFELNWTDFPNPQTTFQVIDPPELPEELELVQRAQLRELLLYLHLRIRDLLVSAHPQPQAAGRISIDERRWQGLIDMQSRLAEYLRSIDEPGEEQ